MNHRVGSVVFGLAVGIIAATFAYRWASQPIPQFERAYEEDAVKAARLWLHETLSERSLEIIDVLNKDRVVGKGYVYRVDGGWEVSGFYRRDNKDLWHPFLIRLDEAYAMQFLRISDAAMIDALADNENIEVLP
ncbi:MAG: hypothetical protein AAF351_07865 [Pseudomonadota bacterium]